MHITYMNSLNPHNNPLRYAPQYSCLRVRKQALNLLLSLGPTVSEWLNSHLNPGSMVLDCLVSPTHPLSTYLIASTPSTSKVSYRLPVSVITHAWPDANL